MSYKAMFFFLLAFSLNGLNAEPRPFRPPPATRININTYQLDQILGNNTCYRTAWGAFQNLACNSAAGRDCRSRGYAGGALQEMDANTGNSAEVCTRGRTQVVPFGNLSFAAGNNLCSGNNWYAAKTLFCNVAASRFCIQSGFQGGMLQEYDGNGGTATITCARGVVRSIPTYVLTQQHFYCTSNWNDGYVPIACASAAGRYCLSQGFRAGGMVQEYDTNQNAANVLCM